MVPSNLPLAQDVDTPTYPMATDLELSLPEGTSLYPLTLVDGLEFTGIQQALESLRDQSPARLASAPSAKKAVLTALELLKAINRTKASCQIVVRFTQLVRNVCSLVIEAAEDGEAEGQRLQDVLKDMHCLLKKMRKFARKYVSPPMSYLYAIVPKRTTRAKIIKYEGIYQSTRTSLQAPPLPETVQLEILNNPRAVAMPTTSTPAETLPMLTVTNCSHRHQYITGHGGVIRQTTGLQVFGLPGGSHPSLLDPENSTRIIRINNFSAGHTYDTSQGGVIDISEGATFISPTMAASGQPSAYTTPLHAGSLALLDTN